MIGIYKITNKINEKSYVGQSVNIERRWRQHKQKNSKSLIGLKIQEYGEENFIFEVLEETDLQSLDKREKYYIEKFNTIVPNGYNITDETASIKSTFVYYSKDDLINIKFLIKNTDISFNDIAKQYNLSKETIRRINVGESHFDEKEKYPLRKNSTQKEKHKKEFFCEQCGAPIYSNSKLCTKCYHLKSRKVEWPTRQELKELIRNIPFTQIGKQFKVSDNTVRRWCDAYKLPRKRSIINNISDEEWEKI